MESRHGSPSLITNSTSGSCLIGQQVKAGDVIAKEGNLGVVYVGNRTYHPRRAEGRRPRGLAPPLPERPVFKTQKMSGHVQQIAQGIFRDGQGDYYQVYEYPNGFNGCVDWTLPLFNPI